ncbi:MAG: preprotein translocase subunit SecY [Candidatus Bipolaricaulota bacterium]|nr:preprotein translocase subunit SecY [Candidatus Bipolaricaulota bacterium]
MLSRLQQVFLVEELRKRILYTLGMLLVYRIGVHIPVPGIKTEALGQILREAFGTGLLQFLNLFTGGGLENFSLFALGVIPYINVSIILSLLIPVVPALKKLQEEGREGRKKLTQYTRWGTVFMALLQAYAMSYMAISYGLADRTFQFFLTSLVALTAGSIFLMWIGERITENGIGNGISMLIMAGIVARLPAEIQATYIEISTRTVHPLWALGLVVVFVAVVALTVVMQQGQRKILVQYAKRTTGRRVYGGHSTYLPLRVNLGGVIPIIFASAILSLPSSIAAWVPQLRWLQNYVEPGSLAYLLAYVALTIFFTYFYASLVFDPEEIAKNLREAGGFVPGVRPGASTAQYLREIVNRLNLVGALFLAGIAVLPFIFRAASGIRGFWLGGTSLLILVGVGIDTILQIEAHLVMRQYESLIKGARFLGRRG